MVTYVGQDRPSEQTKQIEEAVENENQPRKSWWCVCLYLESVSIGWGQPKMAKPIEGIEIEFEYLKFC